MRELIYLSESKLSTFYPGRTSHSVQFTGGLALGPVSAKIDVSPTFLRSRRINGPAQPSCQVSGTRGCGLLVFGTESW